MGLASSLGWNVIPAIEIQFLAPLLLSPYKDKYTKQIPIAIKPSIDIVENFLDPVSVLIIIKPIIKPIISIIDCLKKK